MAETANRSRGSGRRVRGAFAPKITEGQWVDVTAKVAFEKRMEYQGEGIVLYAEHVEVCEPLADEMVYFN